MPLLQTCSILTLALSYAFAGWAFKFVSQIAANLFETTLPGKPLPPLTNAYLAFASGYPTTWLGGIMAVMIAICGLTIVRISKTPGPMTLFLTAAWLSVFLFTIGALLAFTAPYFVPSGLNTN